MSQLPVISCRQLVKLFAKEEWNLVRQRGSHMILVKSGELVSLSIPDHREIAKGTLCGLIRAAGLTIDEFIDLMSL